MIEIKPEKEINIMRNNGKIMKEIQKEVKGFIKPGISTWELNTVIRKIIEVRNILSQRVIILSLLKKK